MGIARSGDIDLSSEDEFARIPIKNGMLDTPYKQI
jgi:hypothetical protein